MGARFAIFENRWAEPKVIEALTSGYVSTSNGYDGHLGSYSTELKFVLNLVCQPD